VERIQSPETSCGSRPASPDEPVRVHPMTQARAIPRQDSEPAVIVLPDPDAVSLAAAERFATAAVVGVKERGRADIATTGGSTPVGIYSQLAVPPLRDAVPWDGVHMWFGDDRYVPRDHPQSNVLPVDQVLLGASARAGLSGTGAFGADIFLGVEPGAPMPAENVHPFPCGQAIAEALGAGWCAAAYAEAIRAAVPADADGWPIFDLVLLGIGPDGHLLSVFPSSPALTASELGMAIPAPTHVEPHVERVTLNPRFINAGRDVVVVSHGAAKAEIMATVFGDVRDPARWPAQLVRRAGVTWLLDAAAAARLPERARSGG
jgi:6-phosphogluconolactonase